MNNNNILKSFLPLLTALVWGLGFVAQVMGSETIPVFYYNALRNIIGAVVLTPIVFLLEKNDQKRANNTILPAIFCGFILFVAQFLQQLGLEKTLSSAKGGFLTSLYTIFVPFMEYFLYKKRFNKFIWISVFLSLTGLFLIFENGMADISQFLVITYGDYLLLINSLIYAFHIIAIDRVIDKVRPLLFSLVQVITVAFFSLIFALVFENIDIQAIKSSLYPLLYCGLVSTAIGYTLQVVSQKNKNVVVTSIMFSAESMFAALGGIIILREKLTFHVVIGCLLIFASVVFAQLLSASKL